MDTTPPPAAMQCQQVLCNALMHPAKNSTCKFTVRSCCCRCISMCLVADSASTFRENEEGCIAAGCIFCTRLQGGLQFTFLGQGLPSQDGPALHHISPCQQALLFVSSSKESPKLHPGGPASPPNPTKSTPRSCSVTLDPPHLLPLSLCFKSPPTCCLSPPASPPSLPYLDCCPQSYHFACCSTVPVALPHLLLHPTTGLTT